MKVGVEASAKKGSAKGDGTEEGSGKGKAPLQAVRPDVPLVRDDAKPSTVAGWFLLVPVLAAIALPLALDEEPLWLWLALVACFLLFFLLFGKAVTGHWKGIFLGRNNAFSLSVTQSLLWTLLVLPALAAAFANRLGSQPLTALDVGFDSELALLMGIPVAGLAGARIINGGKANVTRAVKNAASQQVNFAKSHLGTLWEDYKEHHTQAGVFLGAMPPGATHEVPGLLRDYLKEHDKARAKEEKVQGAAAGLVQAAKGETPEQALARPEAFAAWLAEYLQHNRMGLLVRNIKPSEASVRDFIEGDELGDEGKADFGKAQFLVITLMALAAYAAALGWMFADAQGCVPTDSAACITELPSLSGAVPSVLLMSLLGYLGFKASPSTPTE